VGYGVPKRGLWGAAVFEKINKKQTLASVF
jgi:hypothetical protein